MAVYNINPVGSPVMTIPSNLTQGDKLVFNKTHNGEAHLGTILEWTVPYTGTYRITALGAAASYGGRGARMRGDFKLSAGETLKILVGRKGTSGGGTSANAGGGGSFVAKSDNTPLLVAGGGGSARSTSLSLTASALNSMDASINQNGNSGNYGADGGTDGNGGLALGNPADARSGSGAGFYGDGIQSGDTRYTPLPTKAFSFVNGGTGGTMRQSGPMLGGFGGGGAGGWGGSGGGGGYSGGGAGYNGNEYYAGGGGSYNIGTNQVNERSIGTADGLVEIELYEIVNPPTKPSSITRPSEARVGNTVNVSWTSVPVPSQPSGVVLTSNTVYYEVDFYDGTKWIPVTAKTSATNINYTIPAMADTSLAKFRVRAFVEAYGSKFFTDYGASTGYRESATMTVYNNNKPTVPLAFSAPIASSRYRVGFNYTVSWGASTDLDNDPITYQLDFFNGVSWSNVANGLQVTNRSFIVPSGPDTLNAQFRVRAYDGRDYSDYRYTDKFEVFNNTPPNTPRPFSSPQSDEMRIIDLQTAYTVAWGPADVEAGETAKYEVSFRGSSLDNWVVIRDINHPDATKTSMQHILPNIQDSETAQYRVRAYDGTEYGGYTESNYFSVSGNKVTNTSGFNQELMDRMAINQEVRLSWQPAETVRGTQVVYDIEIFDGFTWSEIAYNVPTTSLVFRIPSMEDTPNAKIRIRSKTPFQFGGYVESEWAETPSFTIVNFFIFDSIAVPFLNDVQKKENADYLRQKVNDMRIVNDLPPLVYTDPVIIRYETAIKAVHFDEIERGILECFDTNPRAKFSNARTEQELRKVKEYADQAELIQELPQRIDFICKALMNQ